MLAYLRRRAQMKGVVGGSRGWTILWALLIGIGVILLAVGVLRVLQTETGDTFDGAWSWAPYVLTLLACAVVAGLAGMTATRRRKAR